MKFTNIFVATSILLSSMLALPTLGLAQEATTTISHQSFFNPSSYDVTFSAGLGYDSYCLTKHHLRASQKQDGLGLNLGMKFSRPVTYLGSTALGIGSYTNLVLTYTTNKDYAPQYKIASFGANVHLMPLVTVDYGNPDELQFRADLGVGIGYSFSHHTINQKGFAHGHEIHEFHKPGWGYSGTAYAGIRMTALEIGVRYVYHQLNQYYGVDIGLTF